jgi:hypothetical protein
VGVTSSLALLRVHVLVVELPGRPLLRLRAEAAVRARGWVVTWEPEDADLVLVCGTPRPEVVEAVDAIWRRVPVPRVRRTVRTEEDLAGALDSAARVLGDDDLQRQAAATGAAAPAQPASGTRFGPVLPHWPAGLIVECALDDRDRVTATGVRRLPAEREEDPAGVRPFVLPVASAAGLLRLMSWPAAALRLDRVVDLALAGTEPVRLQRRLRAVARSVERSATLRWALAREGGADGTGRVLALLAGEGAAQPVPPRRLLGRPVGALPLLVAITEEVGARD